MICFGFMKRFTLVLFSVGFVLLLLGWHWGRLRHYAWKGNLEYTPVLTPEVPRPFEQHIDNYVVDQWPFVFAAGVVTTLCPVAWFVRLWRVQSRQKPKQAYVNGSNHTLRE